MVGYSGKFQKKNHMNCTNKKQKELEWEKPGATIIPVILSSDKTQITLFHNKTAYPVYLTIGNLPKDVYQKPSCQGQVLLAYLLTMNLKHITNKASCHRITANLVHACMQLILHQMKDAGINGVIMASGDGVQQQCHPIYVIYVGDYPEQVLVTTVYTGDSPVCDCPKDELGDYPCCYADHNFQAAQEAAKLVDTEGWAQACADANVHPVQHPFWEDLPYANIFCSITPDLLHQMYQGIIKHMISWVTEICGAAEIDA